MAVVPEEQLERIRDRIAHISAGSLDVERVDAEEGDGPEGVEILVTVVLRSQKSDEWNADDFFSVRREARAAASEEAGPRDFRLVYEASALEDEQVETAEAAPGAKHADDGSS